MTGQKGLKDLSRRNEDKLEMPIQVPLSDIAYYWTWDLSYSNPHDADPTRIEKNIFLQETQSLSPSPCMDLFICFNLCIVEFEFYFQFHVMCTFVIMTCEFICFS